MHKHSGFHLIELLIVVSIIGILITLALPLYASYFIKERRLQAAHSLSVLAIAMEKYQLEHDTYQTATLEDLSLTENLSNPYYEFQIQNVTDATYQLAATPTEKQNDDLCGTLTLNELGEKSISGTGALNECW